MVVHSFAISIPIPSQIPPLRGMDGTGDERTPAPFGGGVFDASAAPGASVTKNVPQLILYYFPETKALQFVLKQDAQDAANVQTIQIQMGNMKSSSDMGSNRASNSVSVYSVNSTDSKLPNHIATLLVSIVSGRDKRSESTENEPTGNSQTHEVVYASGWYVGNFQWDSSEKYWIGWMTSVKKHFASKIRSGLFRDL